MISFLSCALMSALGAFVFLQYNTHLGVLEILIPALFVMFLYGLLLLAFRRNMAAAPLAALIIAGLFMVDAAVFQARHSHVRFSDIVAISDALRVAERYSFRFSASHGRILFIIFACVLLVEGLCIKLKEKERKKGLLVPIVLIVLPILFFFSDLFFNFIPRTNESLNSSSYVPYYGLVYSWYNQYRNSRVTFPEDYSKEIAVSKLAEYDSELEADLDMKDCPDIIVIMNESLTDYELCGSIRFEDPLPHLHNADNGYTENAMAVSIYGGYTANTEYEFLSGNSLLFLPYDSIPYMQFMKPDANSLTKELKALGYSTIAIHPFYPNEWNRDNAYRCFGFDKFITGYDFMPDGKIESKEKRDNLFAFGNGLEYYRGFVSDRECYNKVLSTLSGMDHDEPMFLFVVTIQNHGGYAYALDDFSEKKYTEHSTVNQYLTCSNESDSAFFEFTEALKERERQTVVLMFGDHQPAIDASEDVELAPSLSEGAGDYIVPYIFWSNYEVAYNAPEMVSPNYLSAILKQFVCLPLTPWDRFRLHCMQYYPALTSNYVYAGGQFVSSDSLRNDGLLHDYEVIQDYLLFDK